VTVEEVSIRVEVGTGSGFMKLEKMKLGGKVSGSRINCSRSESVRRAIMGCGSNIISWEI